jgi:integrase/recombinase XerD
MWNAQSHQIWQKSRPVAFNLASDMRKVSLWLGHAHMKTTEIYLRADPMEKIEAIEAVTPPGLRRGRFTVPDKLIASLRGS